MDGAVVAVDRESFPKKCDALSDLATIISCPIVEVHADSPRVFLQKCEDLTDEYQLVIPCTRNMFVRDHLLNQGVHLILTV